jgi:hypothetical protein
MSFRYCGRQVSSSTRLIPSLQHARGRPLTQFILVESSNRAVTAKRMRSPPSAPRQRSEGLTRPVGGSSIGVIGGDPVPSPGL